MLYCKSVTPSTVSLFYMGLICFCDRTVSNVTGGKKPDPATVGNNTENEATTVDGLRSHKESE